MMDGERNTRLGDMLVLGNPPAKLWKALAVIADALHSGFDLRSNIVPGISKRSCVLCSLTVRDFLRGIGFADAKVAPVSVVMWADQNGERLHSLGIGHHDNPRGDTHWHWNGHMVVTVAGFVIDTTLYNAMREQWPDLTGMAATPIGPPDEREIYGLKLLAGLGVADEARGYSFEIGWLDNPGNRRWRQGPDARDKARRVAVVRHMVGRFGQWEEHAA